MDAQCSSIKDVDGWQALCVPSAEGTSIAQVIPFLPLFNAGLIHKDGARQVDKLFADIPPPLKHRRAIKRVPFRREARSFVRLYLRVLASSKTLYDYDKVVFSSNAALGVRMISLNEDFTGGPNLHDSTALLFAVSAGVRDAHVGSSTVKLLYSTIRCAYRGKNIRAWAGPYKGVQSIKNSVRTPWRPYIQIPPFPGYISGHTSVTDADVEVFRRFFKRDSSKAANFCVRKPGESLTEPHFKKGKPGYVKGVTDIPNKGFQTKGFSPAKRITVSWSTWKE